MVNETLKNYSAIIEKHLESLLPQRKCRYSKVIDAMRYSLMLGGKRLRPVLTLEFCKLVSGSFENALNVACALEMIHTYSLIHDDLPCMDDDDLRRGKPSCHVAFGEANALLAGDGLLTFAFETALSSKNVLPEHLVLATKTLANLAGVDGMIGGQVIDLESEGKRVDFDTIKETYALKTGALICAAAKLGSIVGGASEKQIEAAENYAANIGLAFQIVDDILDITSTAEELGKNIGSDQKAQKSTYVSYVGLEKSRETVDKLTLSAVEALDAFGGDTEFLRQFALMLKDRRK